MKHVRDMGCTYQVVIPACEPESRVVLLVAVCEDPAPLSPICLRCYVRTCKTPTHSKSMIVVSESGAG